MTSNWFIGVPAPLAFDLEVPPSVHPIHPADRHLTVAFLGPCGEARARLAWETAARFDLEALDVHLDGTRLLGHPKRPSALAVLIGRGRRRLAEAMLLRDELRAAAGLAPERRPPLPHVTFARIARRVDPGVRQAIAAWARGLKFEGSLPLTELALYTGSTGGGARRYRVVLRRPLRSHRRSPS